MSNDFVVCFDVQENLYRQIQKTKLHVDRLHRPTCSIFWKFGIDVFLKVQDKQVYANIASNKLYFWYEIHRFKNMYRKPISKHPGLHNSLDCASKRGVADLMIPVPWFV